MAEYKYVDWPGLQYYHGKVTELIDSRLRDCIKFGGECTFAELPSPDTPDLNIIFRITDSFTVRPDNDWFDVSCWNQTYPAGTIMQVVQTSAGVVYKLFITPTVGEGGAVVVPTDTYSKAEVDALFVSNLAQYYKKSEVDDKITAAVETKADKEEVAELSRYLEELDIDSIEDRVGAVEEIQLTQTEAVETLTTKVEATESSITAIEENIASVEDSVTDLSSDVDTVKTDVAAVKTDYMKKDEGVSKEELETEVTTQIETQVETIIDTKIEEKITNGVTITSITYGDFDEEVAD